MKLFKGIAAAGLALAMSAMAAPSQATTFIAAFNTGASTAANFRFVNRGAADRDSADFYTTATGSATTPGAASVNFTFLDDPSLSGFVNLAAKLTITGTVKDTPASYDGATYSQTGLNGTFKFVYAGPTTTINGFNLVQNVSVLFQGAFTDAWIQGRGGVGGMDITIANGGNATFQSNYYDLSSFDPATDEFAFNFLTVNSSFGRYNASSALNTFRANTEGKFKATAVPEPATWALMITGFGSAGAMLRARRRTAARAA